MPDPSIIDYTIYERMYHYREELIAYLKRGKEEIYWGMPGGSSQLQDIPIDRHTKQKIKLEISEITEYLNNTKIEGYVPRNKG